MKKGPARKPKRVPPETVKAERSVANASPLEDVLDGAEIQGNSLAGFKNDHQMFLFAVIENIASAKDWLKKQVPRVATLAQVAPHNQDFKRLKRLQGTDPNLKATWINLAFSAPGLAKLTSNDQIKGFSTSFLNGLDISSSLLGDPTDPTAEGNPKQWKVGGPQNVADLLVILSADEPDDLDTVTAELKQSMYSSSNGGNRPFNPLFEQRCAVRSDLPGHEHFGFKDGISQPAARGRLTSGSGFFLSPRVIDPSDPRSALFAEPGQPLVWPGQFVLGYQLQDSHNALNPLPGVTPSPPWAKNGSYVVVRRLKQDVPAFWKSVSQLAGDPKFAAFGVERLGALLVGRWQSGAPIMRTPTADDLALAADDYANNNFGFKNPTSPAPIVPAMNYKGDHFLAAAGDLFGLVCPHAAHIRKANPRDLPTDTGGQNDTLTRVILRRGIPFGPPVSNPFAPTTGDLANERGLMFVSYQTSLKNQFEFLLNHWANIDNQPQSGGMDPLLGQRFDVSGTNRRVIFIPAADGSLQQTEVDSTWITPTGGGYFFAPSISALHDVLSFR
jgi:Dyp-type peroxidase family